MTTDYGKAALVRKGCTHDCDRGGCVGDCDELVMRGGKEMNMSNQEKIDQLVIELTEEVGLWEAEIGKMPGHIIEYDPFILDQFQSAIVSLLKEKGILEAEEFEVHFMQKKLDAMRELRPKARQAKLHALQQALGAPKMIVPRGNGIS